MSGHVAFVGVTVDHLYRDCPALANAHGWRVGEQLRGRVDPEGTDVCGLCYRRWKGNQDE